MQALVIGELSEEEGGTSDTLTRKGGVRGHGGKGSFSPMTFFF